MTLQFKRFPPGLGHVNVPISTPEAASAALGLYAVCRPRASLMKDAALLLIRTFGARALPGRVIDWLPPMGDDLWSELRARWAREVGACDDLAVCERSQRRRSGFALLLIRRGQPLAFLKVRRNGAPNLSHEFRVMQTVWRYQPSSFSIPEPLTLGGVDGWNYLATAPMPSARHRMPRTPCLPAVLGDIRAALQSLPQPTQTPSHWQPMHGDLTPWNLRELPDRRLVLYDWEEAAWAPPDADSVLYEISVAALRGKRASTHVAQEAVEYWLDRITSNQRGHRRDRRLNRAQRRLLHRMRCPGHEIDHPRFPNPERMAAARSAP